MDEVSDPRVGFLRSDVERFCQQLDGLAPALRMRLLEELRSALVGALDEARVEAMAAASDEGWGLRRIGAFCRVSHEQVRRLLAERQAGDGPPVS
ncbi:hypothetical protein ABT187_47125 [Streptomyces sp. NPDC001817]|uniref:hypothetical protein n=1 Tax=Streptomyces sp. NPDC001817 TaxID=3154398 RepID=UPI00331CE1DC